ncbi:hypothetical protein V6N12_071650 [Hibiscus sabdariffa]|uniref:Uncharacterized protein n=1 Tax=Hibiscus sabdariffa TaxID=183260 RepID=A0ABR2FKF8_9ROSI
MSVCAIWCGFVKASKGQSLHPTFFNLHAWKKYKCNSKPLALFDNGQNHVPHLRHSPVLQLSLSRSKSFHNGESKSFSSTSLNGDS